jgi:hypothetical protein
MAHHLLPGVDRGWLTKVRNCFLIRDPGQMLVSLAEFLPAPQVQDTGLPRQLEIFEQVLRETGETPLVIDSNDVLCDPPGMLAAICRRLEIPWMESMLSWPAGPRDTDGAWAPYWYAKVWNTTGFSAREERTVEVPERLREVHAECMELYDRLRRVKIEA